MSTEAPNGTGKQALEQSVLQAVMENAPLPMAQVEGPDHLVWSINPAFCALLGKSEEQLIGRPFEDLFPQSLRSIALLDRVLRTGEGEAHVFVEGDEANTYYGAFTCWPIDAGHARLSGLMIQVTETDAFRRMSSAINEALLISSVQQHELTDVADRLNRRLTEVINERELAQDLLRRNHATFFSLIENAPFGIYVVDARSRIQQVNAAARAVFAHVNPLIGRDFAEAIHVLWADPFASEVIAHFRDTLLTGTPFSSPDTNEQRRDINARESYDWRIERITLPDGEFGVVCYFYDISTLKEAQESLHQADRRKSEFLATLAHELRNPLAPLRNGLELLSLAEQDKATWDQAHGMMKRQLDQMVRLIDELMDLSRISRGTVDLQLAQVDLRDALDQAVETSRPLIERQDHDLVQEFADAPIRVEGDIMRLTQVFANLLNNAAKYTDRGGIITVRTVVDAHEVRIAVEDNGIGIAPDQLVKVFDMFAQVERANDRVQGGLGIGLNIVKHLVGMHGGRIEARSDGLGKGSSFMVTLPLAPPREAPATASTLQEDQKAKQAPLRILIVDDNEDAANMMAMLLSRFGHEVRVAHNGMQALEEGDELLPNVVLMDLGMPVMDGYNACTRMRETTWGASATLVALSGWGQAEDRIRSSEAGFDHHLVKPIAAADLHTIVAEARPDGSPNR
ncbi:MAG: response regulator [Flavobacteriales bacterium]|nr:response regulator [Flavobacteriales bacterium]